MPQGLNRLRKNEWFLRKRDKERTPGPKGQMILLVCVRAKARTYPPVPSALSFSSACKAHDDYIAFARG
jgi:hypothetical protein